MPRQEAGRGHGDAGRTPSLLELPIPDALFLGPQKLDKGHQDRGVEKMREKLILSAIITILFQLQLAVKSETPSPKMSGIEQNPSHETITEIVRENLKDTIGWLRRKKTRLN